MHHLKFLHMFASVNIDETLQGKFKVGETLNVFKGNQTYQYSTVNDLQKKEK